MLNQSYNIPNYDSIKFNGFILDALICLCHTVEKEIAEEYNSWLNFLMQIFVASCMSTPKLCRMIHPKLCTVLISGIGNVVYKRKLFLLALCTSLLFKCAVISLYCSYNRRKSKEICFYF